MLATSRASSLGLDFFFFRRIVSADWLTWPASQDSGWLVASLL